MAASNPFWLEAAKNAKRSCFALCGAALAGPPYAARTMAPTQKPTRAHLNGFLREVSALMVYSINLTRRYPWWHYILDTMPVKGTSPLRWADDAQALLSAIPNPVPEVERRRTRILLKGDAPSPLNPPRGCRIHTRCFRAQPVCAQVDPPFEEKAPGHWV